MKISDKVEYYLFSHKGHRTKNLDRCIYLSMGHIVLCVLLDGYFEENIDLHYVDNIFEELQKWKICNNSEDICLYVIDVLNKKFDLVKGKACIAVIVLDLEKMKSHMLTIGDVRIYYLNRNERTKDDSIAQRLVDKGILNDTYLRKNPYRNTLTRFIPLKHNCDMSMFSTDDIQSGEQILLCSDGFWCHYDDELVFNISSKAELENIVRDLLETDGNKLDNVSVMLLSIP